MQRSEFKGLADNEYFLLIYYETRRGLTSPLHTQGNLKHKSGKVICAQPQSQTIVELGSKSRVFLNFLIHN